MKLAVNTLVLCVAALLALGVVMLYSSSMTQLGTKLLKAQLFWGALGFAGCVAMTAMDYRALKKFALPLLAFSALLLLAVLVPHVGRRINGARRWFSVHGVNFQPSELAKLALIVFVAWYGERFQRQMASFRKGILIPGIFIGAVLALVLAEPDYGTTILLAAVSAAMLLLAGVRIKYFFPPVLLGVAGVVVMILHNPVRMKRIFSWLDLEQTKSGVGYQVWQGILALGAGGWTGLGLGNSRQKLGFVPEHFTDMILSIVGEELGLVGTLLVILAFVLLIVCGLYIAFHARDTFGLLLGSGITFLIGLQAFINIGVVTSVLPNKGLPLPFISYGGSNLLLMLTCVGVLLSIARMARPYETTVAEADDENPALQPAR